MAQPPNPRAQLVQQRVNVWNQAHPGRQVDPAAELAVARQEGLSGGVGDNGTSFGPNQLHFGGAYPGFAPHDTQGAQRWAWSPQGIDYTLQQIANVAGGQHGRQAVQSIVSRFERPANPGREIANALAAYGGGAGQSAPAGSFGPGTRPDMAAPAPGVDNRKQLLLALANSVGEKQPDFTSVLQQLLARRAPAAPPQFSPIPNASNESVPATPLPARTGGVLAELLHEGVGGPTHSTGDHIHVALTDPQAMLAAIQEAQQLGLSVGENPYVGSVAAGVHAPNSFHKRDFPGLYNGRKLGEAIDVHGPKEVQFQQWVQRRYGR